MHYYFNTFYKWVKPWVRYRNVKLNGIHVCCFFYLYKVKMWYWERDNRTLDAGVTSFWQCRLSVQTAPFYWRKKKRTKSRLHILSQTCKDLIVRALCLYVGIVFCEFYECSFTNNFFVTKLGMGRVMRVWTYDHLKAQKKNWVNSIITPIGFINVVELIFWVHFYATGFGLLFNVFLSFYF